MPIPQFLTGLGLATKIALGASTAAAAVGGAGVVGALPAPAQATFDAVAPFQTDQEPADEGADLLTDDVDTTTTTGPDATTTTSTTVLDEMPDGDDAAVEDESLVDPEGLVAENFGAWVSEQAKQGGVDGRVISATAHARNEARKAARADDGTDDSDDSDDSDDGAAAAAASAEPSNNGGGKGRGRNR